MMVRGAEEDKKENERIMESKGERGYKPRDASEEPTNVCNQREVDVTTQPLQRVRAVLLHL